MKNQRKTSIPEGLAMRLSRQFGSGSLPALQKGFMGNRRISFRVNTLRTTDHEVLEVLRQVGISAHRAFALPHAFFLPQVTEREFLEHPLVQKGHVYLQGITAMLPALLLDPKKGERILDLCAAPGGKTSQLAALMENTGEILACENDAIRVQKLEHTLTLQGVKNTTVLELDAGLLFKSHAEHFDAVLADVPCSAEGRIDLTNPRSFSFWSEKNSRAQAKLQRRLLRSAVACLKHGGRLVYSTCTLAPEENEEQMEWLVETFPELMPISVSTKAQELLPGGKLCGKGLLWLPTEKVEGFFVASFQKKQ